MSGSTFRRPNDSLERTEANKEKRATDIKIKNINTMMRTGLINEDALDGLPVDQKTTLLDMNRPGECDLPGFRGSELCAKYNQARKDVKVMKENEEKEKNAVEGQP